MSREIRVFDVRRDSNDGELVQIVDVDLAREEPFFVRSKDDEGWWTEEDVVEIYDEHVMGLDEIWRARRGVICSNPEHGHPPGELATSPIFTGYDVKVVSLSTTTVTYKRVFIPSARDSEEFCRLDEQQEDPLPYFVERMEFVCDEPEYAAAPKYELSPEERERFDAMKKESMFALRFGGLPSSEQGKQQLAKVAALGLVEPEALQRAQALLAAGVPQGRDWETLKAMGGLDALMVELAEVSERLRKGDKSAAESLPELLPKINAELGKHGVDISDAPPAVQKIYEQLVGAPPSGATNTNRNERTGSMSHEQPQKKKTALDFKEVALASTGHKLVLPEGMTKRVAIEVLTRMDKEDERTVALSHELQAYPIEGAYALYRALRAKYGFISLEATPTFFGPEPPRMVGLQIDQDTHVQVPWGRIVIGGISGHLETGATLKPNGEIRFVLQGEVKRRDEQEANEIVALVKHYLTKESLYKGKAVRVRFPKERADFDFTYMPEFIDTSRTDPSELVFPKEVAELVETSLFTPIKKTDLCRRLRVPLKRGILLEGPYGVGKTLTAYVTAKLCEENGWTFLYLDKTADLKRAILLAQNYQPCVIFAEDIDQVLGSHVDRDEKMNDILNTIDGVDGKAHEIIVVLTTNHVDKINRAMLRAGRLDAVIPVRAPDAPAAIRLVRQYSRGLLRATDAEMQPVGEALAGQIPATIREAVERGKLAAIVRLDGSAQEINLYPQDMLIAAASMKAQLKYMEVPPEDTRQPVEKAADSLASAIRDAARVSGKGIEAATNGASSAAALLTQAPEA